ncbi:MAG: ribonuclease HIII [Aquificaceae bacterium]|nr:ribonuclease HIII [Aquificaceae bacterium]
MSGLTLKVPEELQEALLQELLSVGFRKREVPGTKWSVSKEGVHLLLYPSGTLLLQGKGAPLFKDFLLSKVGLPQRCSVGCDESGKGDVFGPLVLCCALLRPDYYAKVLELNLKDCKRIKDEEVLRKADLYSSFGEHTCKVVEPQELNAMHRQVGNLNRLLDRLYGELLEPLRAEHPFADFFVDAYSSKNPFGDWVVFEPGGEKRLPVAVASVLARAEFLKWLKKRQLPKGSSPEVMTLARELHRKDPVESAKLLKTFFL